MAESVIREGEGDHGFNHGDSAGEYARVVAAFALEGGVFEVSVDRILFVHDGGGGLECNAEFDGHAVADTALDAAAVVGGGVGGGLVVASEGVVVFGSFEEGACVSGADFEAFGSGEREHRFGEVGFEFIENGFAPSGGHSFNVGADDATYTVALFANCFDVCDHLFGDLRVGATDDV